MRVFIFALALSVAVSSIFARPVFEDEDSEDGNIMFQLDSDFRGLENEFNPPEINNGDNLFSLRGISNRVKREVQQKENPVFNEIPNIQNLKSDLDLVQGNKLSSLGNTNPLSQTGIPIFQGIPNFSGIQNVPKIPGIPNIQNSENNQPGFSASLTIPNIFSNVPKVPQFQGRIDVPMIPNIPNGIPNFFGNQNQQNGIPSLQNGISNLQNGIEGLQNGIPSLQNGIPSLQNGISNLQNGIEGLQNGIPNLQNGIPNLQNGVQSLQNGIPSLQNVIPSLQNGLSNLQNSMQNLQNGIPNLLQNGVSQFQNGLSHFLNPASQFGIPQFGLPKITVNGLPNLPFGFDPQKGFQNFNLSELEAMYNRVKTEAENNKNNNFLQEMLKNFDRSMKGVRDFFGNMTGGLTNRVSDDINKFFSTVFPFGNRS